MAELNLREFKSKLEMELKKSSSVFVMGHNEPDFDAIGSAFGLYVWAVQNDKNAYIIVDDDESKIEPGVKKIIDDNRDIVRIINKEEFRNETYNFTVPNHYGYHEITLDSQYFNNAYYIDLVIPEVGTLRYNVIKPIDATSRC